MSVIVEWVIRSGVSSSKEVDPFILWGDSERSAHSQHEKDQSECNEVTGPNVEEHIFHNNSEVV